MHNYLLTPPASVPASPIKETVLYFSHALNVPGSPPPLELTPQPHSVSQLISLLLLRSLISPEHVSIAILCMGWYLMSVFASNLSKLILREYSHPVTLTQCQFLINALLSVALIAAIPRSWARKLPTGIMPMTAEMQPVSVIKFITPVRQSIATTFPMGMFQFFGHLATHKATCLILVSLVHTIKGLSPLTTVLASAIFLGKRYPAITYLTLIPLVLGIMLCCYKKTGSAQAQEWTGYAFAFALMLIFVSQNMFAKNRLTVEKNPVLPTKDKTVTGPTPKMDKLSVLFYCLVIGFILTLPVYIISELRMGPHTGMTMATAILVGINGIAHFCQSLMAFQLLGMMLPIGYSIANICKRIVVILVAFLYENKRVSPLQSLGLLLTIIGLYCYDKWGSKA